MRRASSTIRRTPTRSPRSPRRPGTPRTVSKATLKPFLDIDYWAGQRRRPRPEEARGRDPGCMKKIGGITAGQGAGDLRPAGRQTACWTRRRRAGRRNKHATACATERRATMRRQRHVPARSTHRSWLEPRRRHRAVGGRRALHQPGLPGAAVGDAGAALASSSPTASSLAQFLDSATLFVTGLALALVVGMPLGLLLARVRGAARRRSSPTS